MSHALPISISFQQIALPVRLPGGASFVRALRRAAAALSPAGFRRPAARELYAISVDRLWFLLAVAMALALAGWLLGGTDAPMVPPPIFYSL